MKRLTKKMKLALKEELESMGFPVPFNVNDSAVLYDEISDMFYMYHGFDEVHSIKTGNITFAKLNKVGEK